MRKTLILMASALSFSISAFGNAEKQNEAQNYGQVLQAALAELNGSQDATKLKGHMQDLVKLSKDLNKGFAERHSECREYLNAALAVADKMPEMSLEHIEKNYHADAALPKASALCHHAKDLLVHPATVLILLRSKNAGAMSKSLAELTELNSHLAVVQAKLQ